MIDFMQKSMAQLIIKTGPTANDERLGLIFFRPIGMMANMRLTMGFLLNTLGIQAKPRWGKVSLHCMANLNMTMICGFLTQQKPQEELIFHSAYVSKQHETPQIF